MYRDPPARGGRREEEGPEDPSTSSSLVSVALACRSLVRDGWYHFRPPFVYLSIYPPPLFLCLKTCTRKFVAWGSTPRPGSQEASVTLGYHHKPFGSARTARAPRALDLAAQGGGLSAAGRTN